MLPFLSRYATVFRQLLSHLHVIDNLLMCCFRLTYTTQLSVPQLEETAAFLIAIIREGGREGGGGRREEGGKEVGKCFT